MQHISTWFDNVVQLVFLNYFLYEKYYFLSVFDNFNVLILKNLF